MCFELLTFGKDEVASSNLASSSKETFEAIASEVFLFVPASDTWQAYQI